MNPHTQSNDDDSNRDDNTPVVLTKKQVAEFAQQVAKATIEEFTRQVYSTVGKNLLEKLVWMALAALLTYYLSTKGIILGDHK